MGNDDFTLYYQGDDKWTQVFEDRKLYNTEGDAKEELYKYNADIVNE